MKRAFSVMSILFVVSLSNAQQTYGFNEIETKLPAFPKNIVIKLYADWCGICRIQDKKIRKDKELVSVLDSGFYYVEFNAESEETIYLNGKRYKFNPSENEHELTKALTGGNEIAYPAWIILNLQFEVVFQHMGLLKPDELKYILERIQ